MKNLVLASLLILSGALVAQAPNPQTEHKLLQIETEIAEANNNCDYEYFRKIEAKEFIFTDANGTVTTREQDLAGEKDCKKTDYKHEFDEVRFVGSSGMYVLNARHTISGEKNGKPFRVQSRLTDVFVLRDGRWQLLAGHTSRIPRE